MGYYIAVDIGGTQLRAACYPADSIIPVKLNRTPTSSPEASSLECLIRLIAETLPDNQSVEAIGVAAPGPVDPYAGIIVEAPNIPGWIELPLCKHIEDRFHIPVALGNDANLAAMGEWKFGAGRGHHHLVYVTVSTGIGGGVIIADQLLLGSRGLAAELGHITVMPDGPLCGCGHRGHLEALASGTGIANWVEEQLDDGVDSRLAVDRPVSAKKIGAAARQGDELAVTALARAGHFLGQTLADFLHIFNPTALIIGGGVSLTGPLLMDPLKTSLKVNVITQKYLEHLTVTNAALGDEAGLVGALALAHSLSGK